MTGIYKFTNKITGKAYVGQSVDIKKRFNQHKTRYDKFGNREKPIEDTYFHSMLRHYGFHNFNFEILEECQKDELDEKEIYYISKYNTLYPNGYNKDKGGNNAPHLVGLSSFDDVIEIIELLKTSKATNIEIGKMYNVSDQTISDINSGKIWHNDAIQYPIRNGRTISSANKIDEYIYKCVSCGKKSKYKIKNGLCKSCIILNSIKNKPNKDELYNNLSRYNFTYVSKRYGVSTTTIRRWCKAYGIPYHSKEYKSDSYKNKISKEKKLKICILNENGSRDLFESSYEAARYVLKDNDTRSVSCIATHIREVCNGKRNMAYGYKWAYVKE